MLKFAVVGCGYWGPNLVRNLISLPECKVKLVCDTRPERLAHVKHLYPGVETTADFTDVTNDPGIDAVIIATPVRFHFEMAKKTLEARKHTFIEKPMARSSQECGQLIDLSEQHGLTLMVGHTFVHSAPVKKMKEIIDSGQLGTIQYINSRRLNLGLFQKDINVAWDLAPHDVSIILYLLDEMPLSVNCQGKSHVIRGIEDVTNMTLNFSKGAFATIQSSWLDPNKVRETVVVGTRMMLVYDDLQPTEKVKIYDKRVEVPHHYDTFGEFQYSYYYGDVHSPYLRLNEPLKTECEHFRDCILTGAQPASSGYEGLKVVQILEAASESLVTGGGEVIVAEMSMTEALSSE
jgi:predicted dehydrogenase